MGLKSLFIRCAAALGFSSKPERKQTQVIRSESYRAPQLSSAAVFGAHTGVSFGVGLRPTGSAKAWGMSAECRRMVRKGKLRRAGLGGQRC